MFWSYIINYENSANPFKERKKNIAEWEEIAKKYVLFSQEVLDKGKKRIMENKTIEEILTNNSSDK